MLIPSSTLIAKKFTCFLVKIVGIIAIFDRYQQKFGNISPRNPQNSCLPRCILQFLEKLESWCERLNTPLPQSFSI